MNSWIVIAAKDGAKIFEQVGSHEAIQCRVELANPEGRMKDAELGSDRPGRSVESSHLRHSVSAHVGPQEHAVERFLHTLVHELELGSDQRSFDKWILVADSSLYGMIKPMLSKRILQTLDRVISKNLFHAPTVQIQQAIRAG